MKRLLTRFFCIVMILSMGINAALAAGDPQPVSIQGGTDMLVTPAGSLDKASIVHFGGKPWYVLDTQYPVNDAKPGDGTGILLLSRYAFSFRTQWMAYFTNAHAVAVNNANDSSLGGYLGSDIRGYLNSSNAQSMVGGAALNQYTPLRNAAYYGESDLTAVRTSNYWLRTTRTTDTADTPYYIKGGSITISSSSQQFTEDEFELLKDRNELYTLVGEDESTTGAISYNGKYYKPATAWTTHTAYFWDTTPYSKIPAFDSAKTCYTFARAPENWGGREDTTAKKNLRRAGCYAGYGVTGLENENAGNNFLPRVLLAGESTTEYNFAKDLLLNATDKAAILPTSRAGVQKPTSGSGYYGGALDRDTFFLLSYGEATSSAYGLGSNDGRKANFWGDSDSHKNTPANWWLRSNHTNSGGRMVGRVESGGAAANKYENANSSANSIRPAFNLNPSSVLFVSAAAATDSYGKAAAATGKLLPLVDAGTKEYRLTLKDQDIAAPTCALLKRNYDGTYTIKWNKGLVGEQAAYPGCAAYVSAVVKDALGNFYGYAKLGQGQTGIAKFTLPQGITELGGNYTLYLFNELCHNYTDGVGTDYASALVACDTISTLQAIAVSEAEHGSTAYSANTDLFENSDIVVTATYSNGEKLVFGADDYTVTMPSSYNTLSGFQYSGGSSQELLVTAKENTALTDDCPVTVSQVKVASDKVKTPTASTITYGDSLSSSVLSINGWEWANAGTVPTVTNSGYTAYYAIDDDVNYDWTNVLGYNATARRLERTIAITVNKKAVDIPTIPSKVYNERAQMADVKDTPYYIVTSNIGGTDVGTYDVVLTLVDADNYKWQDGTEAASITLAFAITQSASVVDGSIITVTYGDILTLNATIARPQTKNIARQALPNTVDFYCGSSLLGTVNVTNNTAILYYDTGRAGIPVGAPQEITIAYGGSANYYPSSATVTVLVLPKNLTISGLNAVDRVVDESTTVALAGGVLSGIVGNDDVSVAIPRTGTIADAAAGNGKLVDIGTLMLSGAHADRYTLTQPTVTVNILNIPAVPQTGDNHQPLLYLALAAVSLAGMCALQKKRA